MKNQLRAFLSLLCEISIKMFLGPPGWGLSLEIYV